MAGTARLGARTAGDRRLADWVPAFTAPRPQWLLPLRKREGWAVRLLAPAILLSLSACTPASILAPDGPIAAANRQILFNALAIMLAIVVPTIIATLAFAWWFRAGNPRAQYRPTFVYSGRAEMIV
jgi:cytochrome o ubiquinol oxidase subunit 2